MTRFLRLTCIVGILCSFAHLLIAKEHVRIVKFFPSARSVSAPQINNRGDIAFFVKNATSEDGIWLESNGQLKHIVNASTTIPVFPEFPVESVLPTGILLNQTGQLLFHGEVRAGPKRAKSIWMYSNLHRFQQIAMEGNRAEGADGDLIRIQFSRTCLSDGPFPIVFYAAEHGKLGKFVDEEERLLADDLFSKRFGLWIWQANRNSRLLAQKTEFDSPFSIVVNHRGDYCPCDGYKTLAFRRIL